MKTRTSPIWRVVEMNSNAVGLIGVDAQLQPVGPERVPRHGSVGGRPVRQVVGDPAVRVEAMREVVVEDRRVRRCGGEVGRHPGRSSSW